MYRLKNTGYDAYLVGGCVRDLLLGYEPKDFDVVTNASPEQVKKVFRNCRLIGRRFRLAHVHFGREIIEVATFRGAADPDQNILHEDGRLISDNVFGKIEEDVWRRDFSINALYYNIQDFSVIDYIGGMEDHSAGLLKLIGEAETRYREDPVRMLRAVRFAVKLGFKIDGDTEKPLNNSAHLLESIPGARLYDEVLKLFHAGKGLQTFEMLRHYGLFAILFPDIDHLLNQEKENFPNLFIAKALENSDRRISDGKSVTPYFLFSVLLWESVQVQFQKEQQQETPDSLAFQTACSRVISKQVKTISMPKRVTQAMRDVWFMQPRFNFRTGSRPFKLLAQPRFRAAYDFLLLRAETGDAEEELANWWTKFQFATEAEQRRMTRPKKKNKNKKTSRTKNNNQSNYEAYIGLGSNLDNPVNQIKLARNALKQRKEIQELGFSSLYSSPPMGPVDQPDYVNAVMRIKTNITAQSLLKLLQSIENDQGRVRTDERWTARTLDLDLLLYADQQINSSDLTIPHMGMIERAFVMHPLNEIAPDSLTIPGLGPMSDLMNQCPLNGLEKIDS